jgi:hypothetical protein
MTSRGFAQGSPTCRFVRESVVVEEVAIGRPGVRHEPMPPVDDERLTADGLNNTVVGRA